MAPHADESHPGQNGRESAHGNGHSDRNVPRPGDYIQFEHLPSGGPLNRWSQVLTRGHDFPGAQVRTIPSILRSGQFPG
jgi:dihydroxy-acid dehydratase